ncbi:MAG: hypothetical protein ACHQ2Z_14155 [Elusimicrobiota bacterium]
MTRRSLAFLLSLLAAASASAARVEQVPDLTYPASTVVSAAAIAPAPLALFPPALAASVPLAAPSVSAAQLQPAAAEAPAAAAALLPAAADPAASRAAEATAAEAPSGESRALDESIRFDGARAASPAAVAPAARAAAAPRGRASDDAERMASTVVPAWIREELPVAAAKLGRALPPEYEADVLARSKVWVYKWHSRFTYEIKNGLPDGHFDPKFGIRVMLKRDWRKLKDPETHFRVLFAHEYTHWLQNEGRVTNRYGGEIPAVAVEQLRALELVGLEGMKEGRVGFIAEGNVQSFESGRKWARGDMKDESQLYFRGTLGGAAYEVGLIAGRPEAAWEFLNLVVAEKGGLKAREAFERVTGKKK